MPSDSKYANIKILRPTHRQLHRVAADMAADQQTDFTLSDVLNLLIAHWRETDLRARMAHDPGSRPDYPAIEVRHG